MSAATTISTHVLDTSLGAPAAGVRVSLARIDDDGAATAFAADVTTVDGRIASFVPPGDAIPAGRYRLVFEVAAYFGGTDRESFYPEVAIDFLVGDAPQHYHVPLLLSPFGYSTYRGS